jgi:hypothetical protein
VLATEVEKALLRVGGPDLYELHARLMLYLGRSFSSWKCESGVSCTQSLARLCSPRVMYKICIQVTLTILELILYLWDGLNPNSAVSHGYIFMRSFLPWISQLCSSLPRTTCRRCWTSSLKLQVNGSYTDIDILLGHCDIGSCGASQCALQSRLGLPRPVRYVLSTSSIEPSI